MTYGELSSTLKETYLRDDWEGGEIGKPQILMKMAPQLGKWWVWAETLVRIPW